MTPRRCVSRRARATWHRCVLVAAVGLLPGCTHGEPFTPGTYTPGRPFSPAPLSRLTFNSGNDRTPAWLPDGSGIVYSFERLERRDRDRCLGLLPPTGGSRRLTVCNRAPAADDTTDVLEWPSAAPDGRLAYTHLRGRAGVIAPPDGGALVLASLGAPETTREVVVFPFSFPGRRGHDAAAQIRWASDSFLFYVAELQFIVRNPLAGITDTLVTGLEIEQVDLRGGGAAVAVSTIPGTAFATSLAFALGVIYYTIAGDARVLRRVLASGDTSVVHDFGAAGIARDVQVAGDRLVAVVGGNVSFVTDPGTGLSYQQDRGGYLHVVSLTTGAATILSDTTFRYRHPALSPDGGRVVAEVMNTGRAELWLLDIR